MTGESLSFVCNLCDAANLEPRARLGREAPGCARCGSTVRTRAIVHLLAQGLFGRSLALRDLPYAREIRGLGIADAAGYAGALAERFDYRNLAWDDEAMRCDPPAAEAGSLDFILASDVFQLLAPPLQPVFDGLHRRLRPGGLLVFTVPFDPQAATREHFPDLYQFELVEEAGRRRLYNTRHDGSRETHEDLVFHGPAGEALEMRLFGLRDLLDQFARAGFREAKVQDADVPERGITWPHPWSVPIVARA